SSEFGRYLLCLERTDDQRKPRLLSHPGTHGHDRICAARVGHRSHPHVLPGPNQRLWREADQAMRRRMMLIGAIGILLTLPATIFAHRCRKCQKNEYLQATRLSLALK